MLSCIWIQSFRSAAPSIFLEKMPLLDFSCHHGNHFLDFYPCLKLGQNLSSCQVSEKSIHRIG